jgi:hypothetical protein
MKQAEISFTEGMQSALCCFDFSLFSGKTWIKKRPSPKSNHLPIIKAAHSLLARYPFQLNFSALLHSLQANWSSASNDPATTIDIEHATTRPDKDGHHDLGVTAPSHAIWPQRH